MYTVSCQKLVQKCCVLSGQSPLFLVHHFWVALDVPALYEASCGHKGLCINDFCLDYIHMMACGTHVLSQSRCSQWNYYIQCQFQSAGTLDSGQIVLLKTCKVHLLLTASAQNALHTIHLYFPIYKTIYTLLLNVQCNVILFISYHSDLLNPLTVNKPSSTMNSAGMMYKVGGADRESYRTITGYEVIRYGVPMIGNYKNAGTGTSMKTVRISPVVPGAQYTITALQISGGSDMPKRRSAQTAVQAIATTIAGEWKTC